MCPEILEIESEFRQMMLDINFDSFLEVDKNLQMCDQLSEEFSSESEFENENDEIDEETERKLFQLNV